MAESSSGRLRIAGLFLLAFLAVPLLSRAGETPSGAAPKGFVARTDKELTARIDELIAAEWAAKKVKPAPLADDAEFLRRVYLDLAGRIPSVNEVHLFLDDQSSDKRRKVVEKLLDSPQYITHMTTTWRTLLLPSNNNQFFQNFAPQMDAWLRKRFKDNTGYDQMVRDLLTAEAVQNVGRGQAGRAFNPLDPSAIAFFQANENKPENLAAATSRLFMGVKLECAQCHDHPFQKWKRQQFWELAAFFGGMSPQRIENNQFTPAADNPAVREIKIPGTDKVVQAKFLDGTEPKFQKEASSRATLSEWLTSAENPYFATSTANRVWAHFFGIGITEPVDEPGDDNPPSHPELLDELGRQFAAHQFDFKYLIRAITASKAYQLTSTQTDPSQGENPRTFAHMAIKGMTPEQLFDSIALATGYVDPTPANQRAFAGGFGNTSARSEFITKFSNSADKRTEYQTSILQALSLMNGKFTEEATNVKNSKTLAGLIDVPFMTTEQKIEALFLASLSRKPTSKETNRFLAYVEKGGPSGSHDQALADVFWVLLNSSEFLFNH